MIELIDDFCYLFLSEKKERERKERKERGKRGKREEREERERKENKRLEINSIQIRKRKREKTC